jgi:hypothetical protein
MTANEHKHLIKNITPSIFQLIVRSTHAKCHDKSDALTFMLIVGYFNLFIFSWDSCQSTNAKLIAMTFKSNNALFFNFEGEGFGPTTLGWSQQTKILKLIVALALTANFQLVVKHHMILHSEGEYIYWADSEGAHAAPNHSSQLIFVSINFKMSFHFCNDCRIFCEGGTTDCFVLGQRYMEKS